MAISLNQINAEADKRFKPFVVDDVPGGEVTLRNAIRLAKSERAQVISMQSRISELKKAADEELDEDALLSVIRDFFDVVSVGDGGKRLCKAIGDDVAKMMIIMEMYAEDTQLGEALRSAS